MHRTNVRFINKYIYKFYFTYVYERFVLIKNG